MLCRLLQITLAAATLLALASPAAAIELDKESKLQPTIGARVGGDGGRPAILSPA